MLPIPIFINGVEAHTIVRDMLTSDYEQTRRAEGNRSRLFEIGRRCRRCGREHGRVPSGRPAGSMEAGRQAELRKAF